MKDKDPDYVSLPHEECYCIIYTLEAEYKSKRATAILKNIVVSYGSFHMKLTTERIALGSSARRIRLGLAKKNDP